MTTSDKTPGEETAPVTEDAPQEAPETSETVETVSLDDSPEAKAAAAAKTGDGDDEAVGPMEELLDIARTVAIAVGITLFFRFFFFQPFNIPSGSMKSTLLVGDFVVVDKMAYGYSKASLIWPLTRMPVDGRLFGAAPDRGDIAVFKNQVDGHRDYIKRVIGLPGDTVQMIEGRVYLNGEKLAREEATDIAQNCGGDRHNDPVVTVRSAKVYREALPGGTTYIIQECAGDRGNYENTRRFIVPEGHYFLMGDNRDNSQDSRTDLVGFVPHSQLVGKATRLAFSVDGQKSRIWEPWNWPGAIRYGRLFDQVD